MTPMRTTLTALAILLALSAGVPSALASGRDVIDDCSDDEVLSRTYTQKEYRDALRQIPGDFDQYGNCRDIIARAQDAAAGKRAKSRPNSGDGDAAPSAGGAPGGQPPAGPSVQPATEQLAAASPEDRAAAREAARDELVPVGAAQSAGTTAGTGLSELPAPILVLLALLLAGTLAVGATRIRSLVHSRRA